MATRNLTKKFIELRNGAKANRGFRREAAQSDEEHDKDGHLLKVCLCYQIKGDY